MQIKVVLKRLFSLLKHSRYFLWTACFFAILFVVSQLLAVILIGEGIDTLETMKQFSAIYPVLLILGLLYVFHALFEWIMLYSSHRIANATTMHLRSELYAKLNELPIAFYDTQSKGDVLARFISDCDTVGEGLLACLSTLISGVVTILLTVFLLFYLHVGMAIVVILSAPITYVISRFIATHSQHYFTSQAQAFGKMNAYGVEMIRNIKTVKVLHAEPNSVRDFQSYLEVMYQSGVLSQFYSALVNPSARLLSNIFYAIVGILGAYLAIAQQISIGDIAVFLLFSGLFNRPIHDISNVIPQIQSASASAQRIFRILDLASAKQEYDVKQLARVEGDICFQNVYFGYDDRCLFQDVSFHIHPGESVAIIGESGAGKTTLVNLLMRFYEISSGCIKLDNNDIHSLSKNELRRHFGIVLQDNFIFESSILENIAYGKADADRDDIIQAAKKSGAHAFISRLKNGYDTVLHAQQAFLSQGEKQLLGITRVLYNNPEILILDEATSSIDTRNEVHIQNALQHLMKHKTCFVIAHRLATIVNSDVIFVMEKGRIVEMGKHAALLAKEGAYYRLYYAQFT